MEQYQQYQQQVANGIEGVVYDRQPAAAPGAGAAGGGGGTQLDPNAPPAVPGVPLDGADGSAVAGGPPGPAPGVVAPSRRVYVGNLAWSVSWQTLKDHMRKAGEVTFAEVFTEASGRSRGCGVVQYQSEADAANAIATLNDTELLGRLIFVREDREPDTPLGRPGNARAVHHHHHHHHHGAAGGRGGGAAGGAAGGGRGGGGGPPGARRMNERRHPPTFASDKGRKIIVWNLPYSYTWQDLKDEFRSCGSIIRADILLDADGRSKGAGTVVFETPEDAERAINAMDKVELSGRVVDVRMDRYA